MVKDKKKKKRAENHALKRDKQNKQQQKSERRQRRQDDKLNDDDDIEDLDELLAQYKMQVKKGESFEYIETDCKLPSPRINASFVAMDSGSSSNTSAATFYMFGGECAVGPTRTYVYNDFYKYNADKNVWKKISTGVHAPPPRTAHQMVSLRDKLVMFGGEYMSPSQTTFHHWRDTWVFDLKTNRWQSVAQEVSPPARSGHRMCVYKTNYILMFGGFFDTYKVTKYYDDLWLFDTTYMKWHKIDQPSSVLEWPNARSGFQFFANQAKNIDTFYLYGGFCKIPKAKKKEVELPKGAKGKKGRQAAAAAAAEAAAQQSVDKGHAFSDMWTLSTKEVTETEFAQYSERDSSLVSGNLVVKIKRNEEETDSDNVYFDFKWEKIIKQSGVLGTPTPVRTGGTLCFNQNTGKAFLFGGIHDSNNTGMGDDDSDNDFSDSDDSDDDNDEFAKGSSKCLSDAYNFVVDKSKFFKFRANKPPASKSASKINEADDDDDEEEEQIPYKEMPEPHARFNANMVIYKNNILLFGGGFESSENLDLDFTFNDFWKLDVKTSMWSCIDPGLVGQMIYNELPEGAENEADHSRASTTAKDVIEENEEEEEEDSNANQEEQKERKVKSKSKSKPVTSTISASNMFAGLADESRDDESD